jgi:hypothetical protein
MLGAERRASLLLVVGSRVRSMLLAASRHGTQQIVEYRLHLDPDQSPPQAKL